MRSILCLALVVLFAGCRDKVMPSSKSAEASAEELAALQAGNLRLAAKLDAYSAETKKLPDSLAALKAWGAGKGWDAADDAAMSDPWGNPVTYSVIVTIGLTYTIRSAGPDKKDKTPDDLIYDNRDRSTMTFKARNER
jgi:hypothetical protein